MRRLGCADYHELHRCSVEDPERFWPAVVDDLGIEFSQPWERVLDTSNGPEWATWFVGGRVNVARACGPHWARRTPAAVAAVLGGENGDRRAWTFAELSAEVTRLAGGVGGRGGGAGAPGAVFLPRSPAA